MESTETIYFWRCLLSNGFSGAITSTRITMRFSIHSFLLIEQEGKFIISVKNNKRLDYEQIKKYIKPYCLMENLMVIRVEVMAPEKPLISKHLQK